MLPIALSLIVKAATVVRAVQAISSALRPAPKAPVIESVPGSEKVLCGRFAPTRDKYRYCGNNPITFLDPGGLLRRNANGSLQVEVVGPGTIQAPTRNNPGGLGSDGEMGSGFNVNLITNDGKHKIKAFLNKEPGRKPYFTTDCHGRTFADGKFWINNDQIGDLLEGDGYTVTDDPQVGDIVIYRDENNKIVHSMTVSGVDADTGAVTVTGQAGTDPTIYSAPMGEGFNSGTITTPTVYHLGQ